MRAFLNSQFQWPMRLCAMTVVLGLSSILGLATPVDLSQYALLVSTEEGDLEQQVAGAQAGQVVVAAFVTEGMLDHASCYNSGCKSSYSYYGYFVNYYSAYSSEFVGVVSVTSAKY